MTKISNYIFSTIGTISSTATVGTTFKITGDNETGSVVELPEATSFVLKNATQIERFEITATVGVATIVKRGLENGNTIVENVELQKPWGDGEEGYTTNLAFNVFDIQDDNTIADGKKIQFGSSAAYMFSDDAGVNLKLKDGSNSEISLSTIAAAAGADTKVAISTQDTTPSQLEDKLIAGDGVTLTKEDPAGNEDLLLDVDLITTNGLKFTTGQLDVEPSTNTQVGTQRIATDAEALAGSLEDVSINPKQFVDNTLVQPAQTTTYLSSPGDNDTTSTSFVTLKTFTATKSGAYRVEYTGEEFLNAGSGGITRIEVDGIIYGEFSLSANESDTFLGVVHIVNGDAINFQAKQNVSGSEMRISATTVKGT